MMVSRGRGRGRGRGTTPPVGRENNQTTPLKCTNCKKEGHVKANCWFIVGFPNDSKDNKSKGIVLDSSKQRSEMVEQPGDTDTGAVEIDKLLQTMRGQQKQQVRKVKATEFLSEALLNRYSSLNHIDIGTVSKNEWDDSYLKRLDHLDIQGFQRLKEDSHLEIITLAIESLYKEVSPQSVCAILAAAWLLRSTEDPREFLFTEAQMGVNPIPTNDQSTVAVAVGKNTTQSIVLPKNPVLLIEGPYICAALIRLVTKEPANIKNAWESIRR